MKRIISFLLAVCLLASLCACAPKEKAPAESIPTTDNVVLKEGVTLSTAGMTDAQKAVVITAESYYLRGKRVQYDQTSFTKGASRSVNRRTTGLRDVESYTLQNFGYHDCSSFVFDVYWNALGMDFSEGPTKRNTKTFMTNPHVVLSEQVEGEGWTQEIREKKAAELKAALQPGDIIVYRKKGNGAGHAMLYVGNNTLLHSTGGDYTGFEDTHEKNGTYMCDDLDKLLLTDGGVRYLMKSHAYVVLRPLDKFTGELPADTVARFGAMRGIMAEKLCSHTYGQSVNLGEEMTFTFHLENRTTAEKVLQVTDTVPQYTAYVSGADKVDGSTLSWQVTVPAGETKEVSYTVKVTEDAAAKGKYVESESHVSGIAVNCPAVYIAPTLTATEQQTLLAAINTKLDGGLTDMALLNAAYGELGITCFEGLTTEQMNGLVFEQWNDTDYAVKADGALAALNVPRLYGGVRLVEKTEMNHYRTRLLDEALMVPGDVIVADDEVFLYTGTAVLDTASGEELDFAYLEWITGYYAFTVLRPSFAR